MTRKINGITVGWGHFDDNHRSSSYPRQVELSILEAYDCVKKNSHLVHIFDEATMFCTGAENIGVCPGDSGSGFYVEQDGKFYVRGIVSSSPGQSCSEMSYVLHTDILKNLQFLNKVNIYLGNKNSKVVNIKLIFFFIFEWNSIS